MSIGAIRDYLAAGAAYIGQEANEIVALARRTLGYAEAAPRAREIVYVGNGEGVPAEAYGFEIVEDPSEPPSDDSRPESAGAEEQWQQIDLVEGAIASLVAISRKPIRHEALGKVTVQVVDALGSIQRAEIGNIGERQEIYRDLYFRFAEALSGPTLSRETAKHLCTQIGQGNDQFKLDYEDRPGTTTLQFGEQPVVFSVAKRAEIEDREIQREEWARPVIEEMGKFVESFPDNERAEWESLMKAMLDQTLYVMGWSSLVGIGLLASVALSGGDWTAEDGGVTIHIEKRDDDTLEFVYQKSVTFGSNNEDLPMQGGIQLRRTAIVRRDRSAIGSAQRAVFGGHPFTVVSVIDEPRRFGG